MLYCKTLTEHQRSPVTKKSHVKVMANELGGTASLFILVLRFSQASVKVRVPHQIVITHSLMENNQLSLSWSEKHNALGISWPPATNNSRGAVR